MDSSANIKWDLLGLSLYLELVCLLDFIQGAPFIMSQETGRMKAEHRSCVHKFHHRTLSQQHSTAAGFEEALHFQMEMSHLVGEALLQV